MFSLRKLLIISWFLLSGFTAVSGGAEWSLVKGKHFLIYYSGERKFAEKVSNLAEKHYSRICTSLGFTKFEDFWVWEKRVKVYLYPDRESFTRASGAPQWAAGKADYRLKEITGIDGSDAFLESVLPHEIAHLVFRDFVGFEGDVPLWLDEGVAQWQDSTGREKARRMAGILHKNGKLMPIEVLFAMDVRKVTETGGAVEFYAQAVSIAGFMIEAYGTERFTGFCRKLRDGNSIDDALRFTYRERIYNIAELERKWLDSLEGD